MNRADWMLRIRGLLRRTRAERELDEELRSHLELQIRKYIERGLNPAEARRRASVEFGGVERVREECRDARGTQRVESVWTDLKYAMRTLRKSPGFTVTAVLALAIGIGANVALLHSFLSALRPILPFRDADRLAVVWLKSQKDPHMDEMMLPLADLKDWRAQSHAFSSIAASTWMQNMNFGGSSGAERVRAFEMTANLFETLGVQPQIGRGFVESEQVAGRDPVAILGDGCAIRHFGTAAAALGKNIRLDSETYTVVGVLSPGFALGFAPDPDVLLPLAMDKADALDRRQRTLVTYARLRDGVSIDLARQEMAAIEARLGADHPDDAGFTTNVVPLAAEGSRDAKEKLPFFAAIGLIVLLLACINSAVLSLARFLSRHPEMVVRSALGAGRGRLAQQILCEGLVISLIAGMLGFLIALGGISFIRSYQPFFAGFPIAPVPDWRTFALYGFLIGGVTLLFGSAPALRVSRSAVASGLNAASARIASGPGRLGVVAMIFQIAIAVAVLCVTGLMGRTLVRLYEFDLGFAPARLLEGEMVLKGMRYSSRSAQRDFFDHLTERIEAGGTPAALISHFPLANSYGMSGYAVEREDRPLAAELKARSMTGVDAVSPNFFSLAKATLIRGRDFKAGEEEPVAIVNETFAKKYFGDEDPLGKRVIVHSPVQKEMDDLVPGPRRIVGVVKYISAWGPRSPRWPNVYVPFDQNPVPWMSVVLQKTGPAGSDVVRHAVAALDPDIPVFRMHTGRELVEQRYAPARFQFMMLGMFSLVALFLSGIGVFSLVAHSVRSRRREFGIRLALGATPAQVRGLALRGGFAVAGVGLILGIGLSILLGRLMATLLYNVKPWDIQIAGAAVAIVATGVATSCFGPAFEASRTEPMSAVRDE
jgi:predicted permease